MTALIWPPDPLVRLFQLSESGLAFSVLDAAALLYMLLFASTRRGLRQAKSRSHLLNRPARSAVGRRMRRLGPPRLA